MLIRSGVDCTAQVQIERLFKPISIASIKEVVMHILDWKAYHQQPSK
jgi:hypothetical protein